MNHAWVYSFHISEYRDPGLLVKNFWTKYYVQSIIETYEM